MSAQARLAVVVSVAVTLVAILWGKQMPVASATETMPGMCDESSIALPEGGFYTDHVFGLGGAPYECGVNGCHTIWADGYCHDHGHTGIH